MITWSRSPLDLADSIKAYAGNIEKAVVEAAKEIASELEREAQDSAPWQDQTGEARRGLTGSVEIATEIVTIYLAHAVDYGLFLETLRAGKYAVILPTIERILPDIYRKIAQKLR